MILSGNQRLMKEHDIDLSPVQAKAQLLASQGKTPLFYAYNGQMIGLIVVSDVLKETSQNAINQLKDMGLTILYVDRR